MVVFALIKIFFSYKLYRPIHYFFTCVFIHLYNHALCAAKLVIV